MTKKQYEVMKFYSSKTLMLNIFQTNIKGKFNKVIFLRNVLSNVICHVMFFKLSAFKFQPILFNVSTTVEYHVNLSIHDMHFFLL